MMSEEHLINLQYSVLKSENYEPSSRFFIQQFLIDFRVTSLVVFVCNL